MAKEVKVQFDNDDVFKVTVPATGVSLVVDKKKEGYSPSGPNPTELLMASLGACIGVFAKTYLLRHSLTFKDLQITVTADYSKDSPNRLVNIAVEVYTDAVLGPRREVFLKFIHACPVHNTIIHTKDISISLR